MTRPKKFYFKFAVIVVLLFGSTACSLQGEALEPTNKTRILQADDTLWLVQELPEVQEWLALFSNPDGTSPTTGGRPVIEVENSENSTYTVHAYELTSDHRATFGWYKVDAESGEVESLF